jgi:uncharacterized membrane protein YgdD (TMEM256/DUF423 family)
MLAAGAALLAIATACGALGAHALAGRLAPDRMRVYDIAVHYQFVHALGLLALGLAARFIDSRALRWAAALVLAGIVLFSGSLYALALGAPRTLGIATPVGGVALIVGWVVFALAIWRVR